MLDCIDSYELAEWKAFEHAFGPIRNEYRDETLASIHEQLQLLCGMYGQVNYGKSNPAGEFVPVPRPADVFKPKDDDDSAYDEDKLRKKADHVAALSKEFDE